MNDESALLEARLDALEEILLFLALRSPDDLKGIRSILADQLEAAVRDASAPDPSGMPQGVRRSPRPVRDRDGEAARVKAYEMLLRKFRE